MKPLDKNKLEIRRSKRFLNDYKECLFKSIEPKTSINYYHGTEFGVDQFLNQLLGLNVMGKSYKGRLARWNDSKGFGFISVQGEASDVFIHISTLKNLRRRPIEGDIIVFQMEMDQNGKKKAKSARIQGVGAAIGGETRHRAEPTTEGRSLKSKFVVVALLISLGVFAFSKINTNVSPSSSHDYTDKPVEEYISYSESDPIQSPRKSVSQPTESKRSSLQDLSASEGDASRFSCDGRMYCSQMNSCAEAMYFLNNCPGTKMDGNHDGTPCEKQWCN